MLALKMPDRSIMLRGFDHVHYPQTAEDLAQICQEVAGDYDTIFFMLVLTIS